MNCPACGTSNPDHARFCANCGTALAGAPGAPSRPDATDVIPPVTPRDAPAGEDPATDQPATEDPATDEPPAVESDPTEGPAEPDRATADATEQIAPVRGPLRECPVCGARNSPRRDACGRCGADLDTGAVTVPAPALAGDVATERSSEPERIDHRPGPSTGRIVALVVGVGILLGALIGGLIALDGGPGADDEPPVPPPPAFDPDTYDDPPTALPVTAIGASTTLEPLGEQTYRPEQMVDGDLGTAWNNDGSQNPLGVGEVIAVEFDAPVWLVQVVVANGSQSADPAFLGNARLRRARISLDGGVRYDVTFLDRQQLQSVSLPEPQLTTGVLVEVLEAFPGDTYEDLAIAELRFLGWPAVGADRTVGEERAGSGD